jgi:Inner membrane protein CreD
MAKRFMGMLVIWFFTAAAWMVLSATVFLRSQATDSNLKARVGKLWGIPHTQMPPELTWQKRTSVQEETTTTDTVTGRALTVRKDVPKCATGTGKILSSRVDAALHLDQRRKGLIWYSTYAVNFKALYEIQNPKTEILDHTFALRLPDPNGIFDAFTLTFNGVEVPASVRDGVVSFTRSLGPLERGLVEIGYHSFGQDVWLYKFNTQSEAGQVRNFTLALTTDFDDYDFPDGTMSATSMEKAGHGWRLVWRYENLMSGTGIGVSLPKKINPGPFVARVTLFAPVCLLFFFFVVFVLALLRGVELRLEHYFFMGCAFFAFHLLFAYLVDHADLHVSFWVSAAVSLVLVVSYLRVAVGRAFAFLEAGMAQLIYLVLFSYSYFYEGYTGLIVTCGAILTLFVVMQLTARAGVFKEEARASA